MGFFSYSCKVGGGDCIMHDDWTGQCFTSGQCYAVNHLVDKKFPLNYSGYGYGTYLNCEDCEDTKVYDYGHSEFFESWDVTDNDKRAYFACPNCVSEVDEVSDFKDLMGNKSPSMSERLDFLRVTQVERLLNIATLSSSIENRKRQLAMSERLDFLRVTQVERLLNIATLSSSIENRKRRIASNKVMLSIGNGLLITPIAKDFNKTPPCSKSDYMEQLNRTKSLLDGDQFWCWDDTPNYKISPAKVGDWFAFQHWGKQLIFHRIIEIHPSSRRLASWSSNVGQTDRPVLHLSGPLFTISWDVWCSPEVGGLKQGRRTYKVNWLKSNNKVLQDKKDTLYKHVITGFTNVPKKI